MRTKVLWGVFLAGLPAAYGLGFAAMTAINAVRYVESPAHAGARMVSFYLIVTVSLVTDRWARRRGWGRYRRSRNRGR